VARTTSYTWDTTWNRALTATVAGLNQTTYTYSPQNRIASVIIKNLAPTARKPDACVELPVHDVAERRERHSQDHGANGPLPGDTVTTSYNENGDVLTIASPTGTSTFSGYDAWGHPSHVVGENGDVVDYTYYSDGKVKSVMSYPTVPPPQRLHSSTRMAVEQRCHADGVTTALLRQRAATRNDQPTGHRRNGDAHAHLRQRQQRDRS